MKKGFTLIELLVAVVIIGVLATIGTVQYIRSAEKSKLSEALMVMNSVAKTEQHHYFAKDKYTKKFADLSLDFVDKTGAMAQNDKMDTNNYKMTLESNRVRSERTTGDYTLFEYYGDEKITCTPKEHFICDNYPEETNTSEESADEDEEEPEEKEIKHNRGNKVSINDVDCPRESRISFRDCTLTTYEDGSTKFQKIGSNGSIYNSYSDIDGKEYTIRTDPNGYIHFTDSIWSVGCSYSSINSYTSGCIGWDKNGGYLNPQYNSDGTLSRFGNDIGYWYSDGTPDRINYYKDGIVTDIDYFDDGGRDVITNAFSEDADNYAIADYNANGELTHFLYDNINTGKIIECNSISACASYDTSILPDTRAESWKGDPSSWYLPPSGTFCEAYPDVDECL